MRQMMWLIILMMGIVHAGEYQVDTDKKNMVKFISDAPIEDFEGITDNIDGFIYWDGQDLSQESQIYLEVNLNSIDTGIGLRNRHMRENYLETDQYPLTYFKGKIINSTASDDSTFLIKVEGIIFIHGIEQPLSVSGKMLAGSDGYRIQTNFIVKLSDFKIKIPSLMFFKINENMDLYLDFYIKEVKEPG